MHTRHTSQIHTHTQTHTQIHTHRTHTPHTHTQYSNTNKHHIHMYTCTHYKKFNRISKTNIIQDIRNELTMSIDFLDKEKTLYTSYMVKLQDHILQDRNIIYFIHGQITRSYTTRQKHYILHTWSNYKIIYYKTKTLYTSYMVKLQDHILQDRNIIYFIHGQITRSYTTRQKD